MKTFETIADARNGIMDFRSDHWGEVPEFLRARFRELSASASPVDQIVGTGELIWAHRADLGKNALELGGGLIAYATTNAWHGLDVEERGNRIVANIRKDLGEVKTAPEAPEALRNYTVEKEAPAPTPAPSDPDASAAS